MRNSKIEKVFWIKMNFKLIFESYLKFLCKWMIFSRNHNYLRRWIPNPGVPCSKLLGGSKVDSAFHPSEVDKISTRRISGNLVVKSKLPPRIGSSLETVEPHPWKGDIKFFLGYLISCFNYRALRAVYNNHKYSFDDVIEKGNSLRIPELTQVWHWNSIFWWCYSLEQFTKWH